MVRLKRIGRRVEFSCQFPFESKEVKAALKFWHPEAFNIPSYHKKVWDGYVRMYNASNNAFPFGLTNIVYKHLCDKGIQCIFEGFIINDIDWIVFSDMLRPVERFYQREAVLKFIQRQNGIIKVPTRGGKTVIATEILRLYTEILPEKRVLFLSEASDVLNQNAPEIAKFLGEKVGRIQGETFKPLRITAAMIQSIHSRLKNNSKLCRQFLDSVHFVIIDEIHEFLSEERLNIIRSLKNMEWCLGLSATPLKKSKKIQSLELQGVVGNVVYEIQEKDLQDIGVLAQNKVVLVVFEHKTEGSEVSSNGIYSYISMLKTMIYSGERNRVLLDIINIMREHNKKTLMMFNSVEHGKLISKETRINFISGGDTNEDRLDAKNRLLTKENILLVSEIWKKGITLPEVEVFINASVGKEDTNLIQKRGRILGATAEKTKSLMIDIMDIEERYFSQHSHERLKTYEKQVGEDNIIVINYDENFAANLSKVVKDFL